jgi:hypothetical protein
MPLRAMIRAIGEHDRLRADPFLLPILPFAFARKREALEKPLCASLRVLIGPAETQHRSGHDRHSGQDSQGSTDKRASIAMSGSITVLARFARSGPGTFQYVDERHTPMMPILSQ